MERGSTRIFQEWPSPTTSTRCRRRKPLDGIVSVALGLGKTIVDGGITVRFCPKYPDHLLQFFSAAEALRNHQSQFFALDLNARPTPTAETKDMLVKSFGIEDAEEDGTLRHVASTYSPENDALYDGTSRAGIRIVSFAPILRNKTFPLPRILELLMDMGSWGMGTPVEMEFAVTMSVSPEQPKEFAMLQLRPLGLSKETDHVGIRGCFPRQADLQEQPGPWARSSGRHPRHCFCRCRPGSIGPKAEMRLHEVMQFNEKLNCPTSALSFDWRWEMGIAGSLAGNTGEVGPDLRRAS